jgi:hypothetical protein
VVKACVGFLLVLSLAGLYIVRPRVVENAIIAYSPRSLVYSPTLSDIK